MTRATPTTSRSASPSASRASPMPPRPGAAARVPGRAATRRTGPRTGAATGVYADALAMPVQDRIAVIRQGLGAQGVSDMASALQLSVDRTIHILGFPKSTVLRKIKGADVLDSDQSERLFQLQRLIGMVQQMVQDYGDSQGFDAGQWLGQWLEQANPALGGEKPAAYLDTASGVALVESLLHRMISGAYA
ncbi:antitoxin Xre-like helix-turn-helix domain-containing protein [Comamonas terrigena]|uniref:antitoxin Xre-like helix-turn-helix domain-containing protein n=1 Tax=Comamonas terrigena TaxID=32013 RepID=UPI0028A6CE64|nr:antitoxin Xre-like helix-turn-helix domain-containing protein [Comamonas terrigena]